MKKNRRKSGFFSNSMENLRNSTRTRFSSKKTRQTSEGQLISSKHQAVKIMDRSQSCEKINESSKTDSSILQSAYSVDNCLNNLNNSQMDGLGDSTKSLLSITRRSTLSGRTNNVPAGRISHWAESFDSLMNDPLGVKHFKEFLTKEFSEENILFWEACNRLKTIKSIEVELLKTNSKLIFNRYLGPRATTPVNITSNSQQLAIEAMSKPPHPNMFDNQQEGVYYLMKTDSYSRFVKSPLYRECRLCEMESRPLPLQEPAYYSRPISRAGSMDCHRRQKKKDSFKSFFHLKKRSKSPANAEFGSQNFHESVTSLNSLCDNSQEVASIQDMLAGQDSLKPATSSSSDLSAKICHVTVWDGSTSKLNCASYDETSTLLRAVKKICEPRKVDVGLVEVFEDRKNEKLALKLDIKISSLAGKFIFIEKRSHFRIYIKHLDKSLGISARTNKTLKTAAEMALAKYKLTFDKVSIYIEGHKKDGELDLKRPVSNFDGKTLIVNLKSSNTTTNTAKTISTQPSSNGLKVINSRSGTSSSYLKPRNDTEDFFAMLSSMQRAKLNDQRGLISQQHLELPDFLKIDDKKQPAPQQQPQPSENSAHSATSVDPHPPPQNISPVNSNNNSLKSPRRLLHNIESPSTPLYSLQNVSMPNFTPPPPFNRDGNT